MPRLLVFTTVLIAGAALAQSRRAVPPASACNSENESCREDCTMEFGASIRLREKLGLCLDKCERTHARCTERWTELHQAGLDPGEVDTREHSTASGRAPDPRTRIAPPQSLIQISEPT
ncbi:MAG: hypothetical protein IRZ16_07000, partial [Myxococcaceae bacterium]|nr:hypothetical protein [Myxococcaceae bacterium]